MKLIKQLIRRFSPNKGQRMFDSAKAMFEYVAEHPNGEITKHVVHDFGGEIEARISTCQGVFYIRQKFILKDDAIIPKPKEE